MPEPLVRDIKLIGRYSRHNEAEDYRFAAFLKTGSPLSNAEMDATVREVTEAVWEQVDCLACGNCCRTLQIVVDAKDVRGLAARLAVTPKEFEQQYVRVAEDGVRHFDSPCPFLGGDNACAVYEDRPQSCRDFPYLYSPGFRARTLVMVENLATCPIVFNVWGRLKGRWGKRKRA
jgi:uncharacterized protein